MQQQSGSTDKKYIYRWNIIQFKVSVQLQLCLAALLYATEQVLLKQKLASPLLI